MNNWRKGHYCSILETRVSEKEYRQLKKIAEIMETTPAGLMRYLIELQLWKVYGIEE